MTLQEYIGKWADSEDWTDDTIAAATENLSRVNELLDNYASDGNELKINPNTGSNVSGQTYGGFRPQSCTIGAPKSAHKTGEAVDVYDPDNELDDYIDDNPDVLVTYNLYREAPNATAGWVHLSTRKPGSGNRTFQP